MRIRHAGREDKIELQMTPMIDIVFQLLVFFIMTFKIVLPEGDFNIRMPSASTAAMSMPSETPTIRVRLRAGADGDLAGILVEGSPKASFDELRAYIRRLVGDAAGPDEASDQEVELDCDYDLKYDYVIQAVTAISGYIDVETRTQHKLIERIKFAPPKRGGE
jgi:biopolymer transport protein ExbD